MKGTRWFRYSILLAFTLAGLLLPFFPSPPANAQTNCDTEQLSSAYATTNLSIAASRIDDATWTSTMEFVIPDSWPMADQLLQGPGSQGFQNAYNCIVPESYYDINSQSTSVAYIQGSVKLKLVRQGPIYWLLFSSPLPPPWGSTSNQGNIQITFGSDGLTSGESATPVRWTMVTASASGFQVFAPTPFPSAEPSTTESEWYASSAKPLSEISFTLAPSQMLRMALTSESGAPDYYVPVDIEELLMSILLIVCLRWRANDVIDRTWLATLRLCFLVAALSVANFWSDVGFPLPVDISVYRFQIQPVIISAFGAGLIWRRSGWLGRLLVIVAFLAVIVPSALAGLASSFFCWVIILDSVHAIFWPTRGYRRRLLLYAVLCMVPVLLLQLGSISQDDLYPDFAMTSISGCLVVFGMAMIMARNRRRQVPLLMEKRDRLLFSLTVGYAILFVGPQWYAGVHVNIAFLVAIAVTEIVLVVSQHLALAELAAKALQGKTPEQLRDIQRKLIDAEKRIDDISKDLKTLESAPLTKEQFKRRIRLEKEADKLRQWPIDDDTPPAGIVARINAGLRRWLRIQARDEQPRLSLPGAAGPADMALALGPGCEPWQNTRKAYVPAIVLTCVPAVYFAWNESFTGVESIPAPYLYFDFATDLCQEMAFWFLPPLVLAVAWSSLAGRRGPGRAIQIWFCISLPLIIHSILNGVFDQSGTLTPVLECALLLIALLGVGLCLDLSTLRAYRRDVTSFRLFENYVRKHSRPPVCSSFM